MNALTITPAALYAALGEIERIGRVQGTHAYAGGIAALRALLGPDGDAPDLLPMEADATAIPVSILAGLQDGSLVALPRKLTAENGMKAALSGEFYETVEFVDEDGNDATSRIPVRWTTIKRIHDAVVCVAHGTTADAAEQSPAAEAAAPEAATQPAPPPDLAAASRARPPLAKRAGQGARTSPCWPEARRLLFQQRYPALGVCQPLLDELNAIDAPMQIDSLGALKAQASRAGLRMDPEVRRSMFVEHAARARAARLAKATPAPTAAAPETEPRAQPEPPDAPAEAEPDHVPDVTEMVPAEAAPEPAAAPPQPVAPGDEKADAFEYFSCGRFVRDVVADFDVSVATAVGWHAEWKRQQGAT